MVFVELFFALSVSDFSVPEYHEIQETYKEIKECNAKPEPTANCKNVIQQYFDMKEKIGDANAATQ